MPHSKLFISEGTLLNAFITHFSSKLMSNRHSSIILFKFINRYFYELVTIKKMSLFSWVVAIGSKGCVCAVSATIWALVASMWALRAYNSNSSRQRTETNTKNKK